MIVFVLLALILMLVGVTAVSAIDFTGGSPAPAKRYDAASPAENGRSPKNRTYRAVCAGDSIRGRSSPK